MNHDALEGAATRTYTHQNRPRAHQVEAKVPGPPVRCAGAGHPADPAGPPGTPNDITDRVVPLASPSARWLTRQIIKATSGWRNCPIGHHPGR
jgi:NAD(P)-dependent dehydrogenase (short-subunit alcohol dehydrogenase family)